MAAARSGADASSSLLFCFFLLASSLLLLACDAAETHYHHFVVQETPVKRLCSTRQIITVNGMFPGPTLAVRNGDTLVVNVVNRARYNVTIHWHGVRQMRTGWSDGPEFVTQCPIRPGGSYTYRFTVEGQEGTLWWHAHSSWLRATVYGALVIRPRENATYPFSNPPKRDFPILLGEWWNKNPVDVVMQAARTGAAPDISDAFTVNGQPGDLYPCSSDETTVIPVAWGDTVLLRVINAALNTELFFSVAGHTMTVVGADASYTKPFPTPVLMLGPGQTTDVILVANQFPARYYMAARAYASAQGVAFDNTTTTAVLEYKGSGCPPPPGAAGGLLRPPLPLLPAFNDTPAATAFAAGIRSPGPVKLPDPVDVELFFTVGLGVAPCPPGRTCGGPNGARFAASVNNVSFVLPDTVSILQAHRLGVPGVFSTDFPAKPPVQFDYTGANVSQALWTPTPGTKLLKLRYGDTVQLVLQGTSIVTAENHPVHIHGFDFYVLAEGFGNYNDQAAAAAALNTVDPPLRNTVALPVNGWAVVRFVADNPGVWLMHCHLDVHLNWGLAMAFVVEDGVDELQSLEPPPLDLPIFHPVHAQTSVQPPFPLVASTPLSLSSQNNR